MTKIARNVIVVYTTLICLHYLQAVVCIAAVLALAAVFDFDFEF